MLNITIKEVVIGLISSIVTAIIIAIFVYMTSFVPSIVWYFLSLGDEQLEIQTKNRPGEIFVVIRPKGRNESKQKSIYYEIKWSGYNPKGYVDTSFYKGVVLHLVNISDSGDVVTFKTSGQFIEDLSVFQTEEISISPFDHKNIPANLRDDILDEMSRATTNEKYLFIHF